VIARRGRFVKACLRSHLPVRSAPRPRRAARPAGGRRAARAPTEIDGVRRGGKGRAGGGMSLWGVLLGRAAGACPPGAPRRPAGARRGWPAQSSSPRPRRGIRTSRWT
jgi:hypothetical protein